jgi:hypothetical protein
MRTTMCFPCCLLLACVWPLQARETSVKDTVVANDEGAGQKETAAKDSSNASLEAQSNLTIVHLDPGTRLTPFEQTLLDKEEETCDRSIRRDWTGWEGLISDNALAVYSDGYATKADVLEAIKTMVDGHCVMDRVKFNAISKKAGLITYRMTQDWKEAGKTQTRQYYVSSLWLNRGGKWISSFWQETDTSTESPAVKDEDSQQGAEKELLQLERQWAEAGVKRNVGFFEKIASPDYVIVDCDGDIRNKALEIANFRHENQTTSTVSDMKVRVYGGSAVVVGAFTIAGTYDSQSMNLSGNFTDVWIKPNRKWQLVSTQNTCKTTEVAQNANLTVGNKENAERDAEKELIQLEKDFAEATLKHDREFYDRILADDWINIHEDGSVGTKQGDAAHKSEYDTATFDDIKVRVYGDSAVAVGRYSVGWTEGGQRSAVSGRFTDVWVRRNGRWQIVSSQNTPIPEANATEFPPDAFFIAKEKEDWEALKHKDKTAANRLLADDFVGMYDFGFFNKSEWIKQLDDQYTVDDYTIENPRVLHPSANTALLLYTSTCKGTGTWAEDCSHPSRASDLYVERNGQWLALFSQDTQATSGESDDAVLKAILSSEKQIVGVLSRDDIEGFGSLLPDDVVDIWTDGVHPKPEWLREMEQQKKDGYLFRDFRFEDPKLVRLGPDAAILIAKEIIHEADKGKPVEDRLYTLACYVRRNGKWMPIVYQDTPIQ